MGNYHQPYRGLPAEIRIQIWRLVVPPSVAILKDTLPWADLLLSSSANTLKLYPPLHIQLLRLNRQIYNETLPIFQATGIRLRTCRSYTYVWPTIDLAMQSPAFGTLEYAWNKTASGPLHRDSFLTRFMTVRSPHPLRKLIVKISQAGMETEVVQHDISRDHFRDPGTIKELDDHDVLAAFAAATLMKGLVTDRVIINIERISIDQLTHWTSQALRECTTLDPAADDPMFLNQSYLPARKKRVQTLFLSEWSHAAPHIDIEVGFVETSEIGVFTGRVVFTKADQAQDDSSGTDNLEA